MEHSGKGLGGEPGALSCKMSVFATNSQGYGEDCMVAVKGAFLG